jgi:hypothetical protein
VPETMLHRELQHMTTCVGSAPYQVIGDGCQWHGHVLHMCSPWLWSCRCSWVSCVLVTLHMLHLFSLCCAAFA